MDWKQQLQQVYKSIQHKAKHERPKDKFDYESNYKGRKGFNDVGIPLTARAAKQKQKNRSMYAARAAAKYWSPGSQLRNINDQRKASAEERWGNKEDKQQSSTKESTKQTYIRPERPKVKLLKDPIVNCGSSRGYPYYMDPFDHNKNPSKYQSTNRGRVEKKPKYYW